MPLYIDPAWEYFEPDPEVAEAVYGNHRKVSSLDLITTGFQDAGGIYNNQGLRFGSGNPDNFTFHLAPEKPQKEVKHKQTDYIYKEDTTQRSNAVKHKTCLVCATVYPLYRGGSQTQKDGFCRLKCMMTRRSEVVRTLYIAGVTLDNICAQIGVCRDILRDILGSMPDLEKRSPGWKPKRDRPRKVFGRPVSEEELRDYKSRANPGLVKQPGNRRGRPVRPV